MVKRQNEPNNFNPISWFSENHEMVVNFCTSASESNLLCEAFAFNEIKITSRSPLLFSSEFSITPFYHTISKYDFLTSYENGNWEISEKKKLFLYR